MSNEEKSDMGATKYRGWKAMPYVIGNETFEKLGTIGTSTNLLVYLTVVFHMERYTATTLINVWNGTTNIATVFGAFLSDAYFGRYKTLGVACVSSFIGMVVLTLTAAIVKLHPHYCPSSATGSTNCDKPTRWQFAFLLVSLSFLVIGAGGIRPCNLAFGADQFDPNTKSGKKGINSFFNWFYFTFTFAMMISSTVIIYVQTNISWTIGLAIPAGLMFLSCAFFFIGSPIYVKVKPEGSPFTGALQVLVASIRKRGADLPPVVDGASTGSTLFNPKFESELLTKLSHTNQFRFLDKAAIIDSKDIINLNGSAANPWRLCSIQKIEEIKCLIRVIPIWFAGTMFYITLVAQTTYTVFQALQSDRQFGGFTVPAGSFVVFNMAALTIWLPFYDRILVPWMRRLTGEEQGITLLQRIGIGIVLSIVLSIVSGLVEQYRRSLTNGSPVSRMSSMWLVPQLALAGLAEAFTLIGQVEFNYKQFPENMRSVAGSFLFCGMALANYIHGLMVLLVNRTTGRSGNENWLAEDLNKGRLDYFYYLIVAMSIGNFLYFLVVARWYRYKCQDRSSSDSEIALEETKGSGGHAC